jgi:hypothetical protein
MKRFLRYLRLALSATCLIACVLLIVLWVRSYSVWDIISYSTAPPPDMSGKLGFNKRGLNQMSKEHVGDGK